MILKDSFKNCKEKLLPAKDFLPFPKPDERAAWKKIIPELGEYFISQSEKETGRKWNSNSAMDYINYYRHDRLYDNHTDRNILARFMYAECIENKGRFIEDIVNGAWSMCEKTDWAPPQHLNHMYDYSKNFLPDIEEENRFIDLHIAMTASLLSWIYYFFKESLDEITPLICRRIKYEVRKRVFDTLLKRNDFGWMGFVPSRHKVNNWNPFIISHCIECILILEDDEEKRQELIKTCLGIADNYFKRVPEDGGCDEGPHYWSMAGGSVYDILELMYVATNGEYNLFTEEKVRKTVQYLKDVHIYKNYFVNFADTRGKTDIPMALVRFGKYINDSNVSELGFASGYQHGSCCQFRIISDILMSDGSFSLENKVNHNPSSWLENTQVGTARAYADSHEGLFLGFKGGHNDESHNHNDVGNFIVYSDGMPGIIDIGMGTYVPITFSDRRYELYNTQSAYHNLPTVNLCMQEAGRSFAASDVSFEQSESYVKASMSIKDAYPEDAGINEWSRSLELDRSNPAITVTDKYSLSEMKNLKWTLMTYVRPEISGNIAVIPVTDGSPLKIECPQSIEITWEQLPLNAVSDGMIKRSWGELYRIILTQKDMSAENTVKLVITQMKENK